MTWIAGADGCHGGWICLLKRPAERTVRLAHFPGAPDLLFQRPRPDILAIDIPIGLTEAGPRACDAEARALLGWPRRASVFPAPVRPALPAATRLAASDLTRRADGRAVGVQAWGIFPKVREVDAILAADPGLQGRVREVHPEVSFLAWRGRPMRASKKTPEGRREREALVERWLGPGVVEEACRQAWEGGGLARKVLARDDIVDAFAALWTAERIWGGEARVLPGAPEVDGRGLRMEIVY